MIGGESFSLQIRYPVTYLVVTRRDKSAPITVKGMIDREGVFASVAILKEF